MSQAYRDLQAGMMNPTHLEAYPDEQCDWCGSDLDTAYRVMTHSSGGTVVLGQCCVEPIERCDNGCGRFRCRCPEER